MVMPISPHFTVSIPLNARSLIELIEELDADPSYFLKLPPEKQRNRDLIEAMFEHRAPHIPSLINIIEETPSYHNLLPPALRENPELVQAAFRHRIPEKVLEECLDNLILAAACVTHNPQLILRIYEEKGFLHTNQVLHTLATSNEKLSQDATSILFEFLATKVHDSSEHTILDSFLKTLIYYPKENQKFWQRQFVRGCIKVIGVAATLQQVQQSKVFLAAPREATCYLKPTGISYIRDHELFSPNTVTVTECLRKLLERTLEVKIKQFPDSEFIFSQDETILFRSFILLNDAKALYALLPSYKPAILFALTFDPTLFIDLLDKGSSFCDDAEVRQCFFNRIPPRQAALRFPKHTPFFMAHVSTEPIKKQPLPFWDGALSGAPHALKWFT
jgi:hypothetical protein